MPPQNPSRVARQHVLTDKLLGLDAVPCEIGSGTDHVLPAGSRGRAQQVMGQMGETGHQKAQAIAPNTSASQISSAPARPTPVTMRSSSLPMTPSANGGAAGAAPRTEPIELPVLALDAKVGKLSAMYEEEVRDCRKCPLHEGRMHAVFGEGNPEAAIMFVGEGPGYHEDVQGRPFVGRSGELLEKQISAMGMQREDVYIANVVKCRPPNNRTPIVTEVEACRDYLQRQIAIIQPKVIITLGGPAAKLLLETSEGITRLRGRWCAYKGVKPEIPVMPTFHPAYLLRQYTKENRMKVWSDLQAAMEKVNG
ncbi:uracil-DNA glycosylase [Poriferisphaera sp. WC338]|uniref:uracil-DNA glycosylase n=1 Tax=Poriferisphaera sp. WC338 TaxID=3425129 RepID=UPI003D8133A3